MPTDTLSDIERPAAPPPPVRRGLARWHLGQLVIATIGVLLGGAALALGFVFALDPTYPSQVERVGYLGTDTAVVRRVDESLADLPGSNQAQKYEWLVLSRVDSAEALRLVNRYSTHVDLVRAALIANGYQVDIGVEARYERKRWWVGFFGVLIALGTCVAVGVMWWRWFGARAR